MAWGNGGGNNNRGGNGGGGGNGGSKPNTGALFENDKKQSDNHPDQNGSCDIECPHCGATWASWVSGWFKQSKAGKNYLSLSFRPKEENGGGQGGNRGGGGGGGQQRNNNQGGGQQQGGGGGGWNRGQQNGQRAEGSGGWQGSKKAYPPLNDSWRNKHGDIEDEIPFR